jgi:hypothetical protein
MKLDEYSDLYDDGEPISRRDRMFIAILYVLIFVGGLFVCDVIGWWFR